MNKKKGLVRTYGLIDIVTTWAAVAANNAPLNAENVSAKNHPTISFHYDDHGGTTLMLLRSECEQTYYNNAGPVKCVYSIRLI